MVVRLHRRMSLAHGDWRHLFSSYRRQSATTLYKREEIQRENSMSIIKAWRHSTRFVVKKKREISVCSQESHITQCDTQQNVLYRTIAVHHHYHHFMFHNKKNFHSQQNRMEKRECQTRRSLRLHFNDFP